MYELDLEQGRHIPRPERDARVSAGSGPHHVAFHPDAPFVYVINELAATVTAFGYDGVTVALGELQTVSMLPDGSVGYRAAAEIAAHPSGRFLYATNRGDGASPGRGDRSSPGRGEDSIVWFSIDRTTGRLTPRGRTRTGGRIPRSFVIEPSGDRLYLAHQGDSNVEAFRIDAGTGAPRQIS